MITSDNFPRLSHKEFTVLEMLVNNDEMYGLEMVTASEGELKRGTVYITLQRMAEKGLVDSRVEIRIEPEIGIPRRWYKVSEFGRKIFKAQELALRYLQINLRI